MPESPEYEDSKKKLKSLINTRRSLESQYDNLVDNIASEETAYLKDAWAGNVAQGFDQYSKSSQNRRRLVVTDADRIFTKSTGKEE